MTYEPHVAVSSANTSITDTAIVSSLKPLTVPRPFYDRTILTVMVSAMIIYLSGCLCLFVFILNLIKFFNRAWWTPLRIQSAMRSQGVKGPSYRFLHGNTKEITRMRDAAFGKPMELSNEILPRIQPHVYSWVKLYGMNFLNWYGTHPQLAVTEPEWIKEILSNKDGAYPKKVIQIYADKFLGDGLVASQGEKWSKMRKLANHAFHGESLKDMAPAMIASVESMLERWRHCGDKEIEVFNEFRILTSEIISRTAFGSSYLEGQQIFNLLMKMAHLVARNNYKVRIPGINILMKTEDDIEADKLAQGIKDLIVKMIKKREEENSFGSDFLGLLLKAYHENDKTRKITLDDLVDECKTFYVAGHETTTSSLTWTTLLLAIHTEWQDKARKEVLELFGHQNPNLDTIGRLKTMSMIVNESLRLYPPVFNITREVQREVKFGNLLLPAKLALSLSVLAAHHNSQAWGEDVHLFKPERFADGIAQAAKDNAAAYLPFGSGPRSCVGSNFAITEVKVALCMILQRYRFTLSPAYEHSPIHILTLCPKHGLQIVLQAL